jgi:hypoxia-inducible factor prolyl hydroxylase
MVMRTDAMASVYPGDGTHYIRHIDNNTKNGRVLTTLLYLNPMWEPSDGGCFKLFLKKGDVVIEPIFNRFLVFWSDSRCPHEVLPAHSLRYAMSIWYNDSAEILADSTIGEEEPDEAEQEQRMARVLQTLGIAGNGN